MKECFIRILNLIWQSELFKGDLYLFQSELSLIPQYRRDIKTVFSKCCIWEKNSDSFQLFCSGHIFLLYYCFGISVSFYRKKFKQLFVFGLLGGILVHVVDLPCSTRSLCIPCDYVLTAYVKFNYSKGLVIMEKRKEKYKKWIK